MTANLPSSALAGTGDGEGPPNTFLSTPAIVRREIRRMVPFNSRPVTGAAWRLREEEKGSGRVEGRG